MNGRRRIPEAASIASLIRVGMAKKNWTKLELSRQAGVSQSLVGRWTEAQYVPTLEMAQRLSELLTDDRILNRVRAARIKRCAYKPCSTSFHRPPSISQIYCSPICKNWATKNPAAKADVRQVAIDAMCAACEPEGICRTEDCALRAFSPLPFIALHRNAA